MPNPAILTGDFSAETYPRRQWSGLPAVRLPAYGTADCATLLIAGRQLHAGQSRHGTAFPGQRDSRRRFTRPATSAWLPSSNGFWQTPTIANQPEGAVNFIKNWRIPT